ncbi:hypothetical protein GQ457_07G029660 [Hibiscus cannabinus]
MPKIPEANIPSKLLINPFNLRELLSKIYIKREKRTSRQLQDDAVRAFDMQQSTQLASTPLMRNPVEWAPPEQGWVKLNTDGARHATSGMASCGGVLRDHLGEWILGFSKFIGVCSVIDAELWGVLVGLESAWSRGFRRIVIETDSLDVFRLLQSDNHSQQRLSLLMHLNRLRHQDWIVKVQHIVREENRVADSLAKTTSSTGFHVIYYDLPPPTVVRLL